ncbi:MULTISPECIES: glutathione peroxidase [Cysteiniphilum]|uniref:Glutathione amide-dependent peroxidase n=1 Tax=Cysteiniphilum litorale TaxID=2056700 RepID=A0A8J2Z2C3_9GAMM|nr:MULTISPECIES: glutathione peroxidase [Cysteiniphilum]GGF87893.1 glutathione amide-dependent peroxidase [Cysteiniphilum litorale]
MFPNLENQQVPNVTFKTMQDGQWQDVTSDDVFKGKNVIVFSLPGAFTPTCSSSHVPRFNELFPVFKEHGIDRIVCMSVNDTFVMNAWKKEQKAENIDFIPDGNGEFTEKMGLLVDKEALGFGKRSWRYSMLVKDSVIAKMFIEPNKAGDPFEVSDADTMLKFVAPNAQLPKEVTIFTKPGCPHCKRAKKLLAEQNQGYEEVVLGHGASMRTVKALTNRQTVPQIYIDGQHIGGADDLEKYYSSK